MIYVSEELQMKPKDDDDQMMGRMDSSAAKNAENKKFKAEARKGAQIISSVDWNIFLKKLETVPREQLLSQLAGTLIQTTHGVNEQTIRKFTDSTTRETFIKTATIQLMSTPEYQLC